MKHQAGREAQRITPVEERGNKVLLVHYCAVLSTNYLHCVPVVPLSSLRALTAQVVVAGPHLSTGLDTTPLL